MKKDFGDKFERLSVSYIVFLLYSFGLIDGDTFLKLRKIITERNKLVHPTRIGIGWRYTKPETSAKELLQQAKDCITIIQQISV
ncbi:hypothetical protein KAS14_06200 [Candidatus Bathyarchaeota archaeon]|nr:hypothetical protein [Candidatus Bathyarchaeota archaeon]